MDCDACGYEWAAVHPVVAEYLQCPVCHHMTPAPYAEPNQMNIERHPIYKDIYDLCREIETLPASDHATKLVVMASALEKPADKLVAALETIVRDFDQLNGTECSRGCGKCIRCIAKAALDA